MLRLFLLAVVSLAVCNISAFPALSAASTNEPANEPGDKFDAKVRLFDTHFKELLTKNKIPGGAYAILRGGKIYKIQTYGQRKKGETAKVNADTVFRWASVSKTFAGALTAKLVEEKKLGWNEPVTKFVPGFQLKKRGHTSGVQLRHLLSHSAGIIPNAYDNYLEDGWSVDKIIPRFKRVNPICSPGNCYGYQNIVFSLIEPAIETRTGQTYKDLIEQEFITPLKMKTASIGYDGFKASSNRALPHVKTRRGWRSTRVTPNYYEIAPAAGANGSITDLAKWVEAQMVHDENILPLSVVNTVTNKRVRTKKELYKRDWRDYLADAHYGYGWRIYDFGDDTLVFHGGGVTGYRSNVAYAPDHGIGHVILLNAETRLINDLSIKFWSDMLGDPKKTVRLKKIQQGR
ncbi:serine hydrolase [Kordiimonas sp. SCSIO 12610]|uniref:serine hydrolase domain-containing protein n=1 Tax=Kordiimonas sp. SCSIO 12610 TaxID=2829597 RepID=UPI00210A273C|nr:serine hydrolase domain-containing protein [Kordiimonas sp. SCSIO 12610]UTW56457.1 beta-lactamase family protein [Kordiimonas sp. SCSIO 12610]